MPVDKSKLVEFFKQKGYPSRNDDYWYEWIAEELLKFIPKIEEEQKCPECGGKVEEGLVRCVKCIQRATSPASEPIEKTGSYLDMLPLAKPIEPLNILIGYSNEQPYPEIGVAITMIKNKLNEVIDHLNTTRGK